MHHRADMLFRRGDPANRSALAVSILGFPYITYLGMPHSTGRLRKADLEPVITDHQGAR